MYLLLRALHFIASQNILTFLTMDSCLCHSYYVINHLLSSQTKRDCESDQPSDGDIMRISIKLHV